MAEMLAMGKGDVCLDREPESRWGGDLSTGAPAVKTLLKEFGFHTGRMDSHCLGMEEIQDRDPCRSTMTVMAAWKVHAQESGRLLLRKLLPQAEQDE